MRHSTKYKPEGNFDSTYMWKVENGYYMIQTDNTNLKRLLRNRRSTRISAFGVNCPLVVYLTTYKRCDVARKSFRYLTGKTAIHNKEKDVYEIKK